MHAAPSAASWANSGCKKLLKRVLRTRLHPHLLSKTPLRPPSATASRPGRLATLLRSSHLAPKQRHRPSALEDMFDSALLLAAAFVAGALNAVAGGGSFLTLPALVFTGVPPVVANATGTVALLPRLHRRGLGLSEDTAPPPPGCRCGCWWCCRSSVVRRARRCCSSRRMPPSAAWCPGCRWRPRRCSPSARNCAPCWRAAKPSTAKATVGVLAVAAYGGYFNGGLGILLLALFGLLGQTQLNAMNGFEELGLGLLTAIAVVIYAAGGVVQWPQALMMMVAATAGGYGGRARGTAHSRPRLRGGIVVTGW